MNKKPAPPVAHQPVRPRASSRTTTASAARSTRPWPRSNGGGGVGPEPGGVYEVVRKHDADLASPLERGQGLVERAADAVVVRDEARGLTGPLEEVREGVGAVFESAHDARGCGNRHNVIITQGVIPC